MIVDMDVRCHLYGDKFSAKKVEELTGLTLENKIEIGEIAIRGKYKGAPFPFGTENSLLQVNIKKKMTSGWNGFLKQ